MPSLKGSASTSSGAPLPFKSFERSRCRFLTASNRIAGLIKRTLQDLWKLEFYTSFPSPGVAVVFHVLSWVPYTAFTIPQGLHACGFWCADLLDASCPGGYPGFRPRVGFFYVQVEGNPSLFLYLLLILKRIEVDIS